MAKRKAKDLAEECVIVEPVEGGGDLVREWVNGPLEDDGVSAAGRAVEGMREGVSEWARREAGRDSKAGVSLRHRAEWLEFRHGFLDEVYRSRDADAAKFAKLVADILKVSQEGERRAWGFAGEADADNSLQVGWE